MDRPVRDRKLSVKISGREYLTAEAWTLLGGADRVWTPVVAWTTPARGRRGLGGPGRGPHSSTVVWIGAAESMCTRAESKWAKRGRVFSCASMCSDAVRSRGALRAPLGADRGAFGVRGRAWPRRSADIVVDPKPGARSPRRARAKRIRSRTRSSQPTTRSPSSNRAARQAAGRTAGGRLEGPPGARARRRARATC